MRLRQIESSFESANARIAEMQTRLDDLELESRQHKQMISEKYEEIASAESRLSEVLKNDKTVETLNQLLEEIEGEARTSRVHAEESEHAYKALREQGRGQNNNSTESTKMEIQSLRKQLESTTNILQNTQQ